MVCGSCGVRACVAAADISVPSCRATATRFVFAVGDRFAVSRSIDQGAGGSVRRKKREESNKEWLNGRVLFVRAMAGRS
jgi:hypothetical protein